MFPVNRRIELDKSVGLVGLLLCILVATRKETTPTSLLLRVAVIFCFDLRLIIESYFIRFSLPSKNIVLSGILRPNMSIVCAKSKGLFLAADTA